MKSDKTNFLRRKEKLERNISNFFYSFNLLVEQVNLFNLTEFAIKKQPVIHRLHRKLLLHKSQKNTNLVSIESHH